MPEHLCTHRSCELIVGSDYPRGLELYSTLGILELRGKRTWHSAVCAAKIVAIPRRNVLEDSS